jgi:hypothetical protein
MSGNVKFNGWINDDGSENYKCRAWVNFNGTGTVAIRASGNVSSITDNGVGDYTVNFTTAMPDAKYSAHCSVSFSSSGVLNAMIRQGTTYGAQTTTAVYLNTGYSYSNADAMEDMASVFVTVFR